MRSWLKGAASKTAGPLSTSSSRNASKQNVAAAADPRDVEIDDLEHAMSAAARILNDDIEGAEAQLRARQDTSSFHQLGLGIAVFMRSILGFEKDIMAEAGSRLAECETRAWSDMKKAQKHADGGSSSAGWFRGGPSSGGGGGGHVSSARGCDIYPPGTEFQLLNAEAQLMGAVISVMQESLTEGVKGFYKLRKAFVALDAIMEQEAKVLVAHRENSTKAASSENAKEAASGSDSDSDLEFIDAEEATDEKPTTTTNAYTGHLGKVDNKSAPSSDLENSMEDLSLETAETATPDSPISQEADSNTPLRALPPRLDLSDGPDSSLFTNPVDAFVHSGANMCFGILLLIISMVPPAFSKLLYIIGFKGDRDRGVQMLWQSTKFSNVNGGVAGLVLLAYYNGILGFADILPSEQDVADLASPDEIVGYPKEQCISLLERMRAQYPDSRMWKVEEARVLGNARRLPEAIEMLKANSDSKMRQVMALTNFELSINALCLMDWQTMRDGFLRCIELNDWSHSLYYYFVGAGEVEMYRDAVQALRENNDSSSDEKEKRQQIKSTLEVEAKRHKRNAEEYLRKATTMAGRKKFMARQMPFEVFAMRKVAKWEARAKEWGCDLADAVGASPGQEVVYLWAGAKRMPLDTISKALGCLRWERCTAPADKVDKIKGMADEAAVKANCEGSLLFNLGRYEEAREVLKPVVGQDRALFKGDNRDDWAAPAAHYELAVLAWKESCDPQCWPTATEEVEAYRRAKVAECEKYLDQVRNWEAFVLDARVGMKVQTGLDTIAWFKGKKGWASS